MEKAIYESKVTYLGEIDGEKSWFTMKVLKGEQFAPVELPFAVYQYDRESEDAKPWNCTPVRFFATKKEAIKFADDEVANYKPYNM